MVAELELKPRAINGQAAMVWLELRACAIGQNPQQLLALDNLTVKSKSCRTEVQIDFGIRFRFEVLYVFSSSRIF